MLRGGTALIEGFQTWRRQALGSAMAVTMPSSVPLHVEDPPVLPAEKLLRLEAPHGAGAPPAGSIEIELGRTRVRVQGSVDADALRQVLTHLGRLR